MNHRCYGLNYCLLFISIFSFFALNSLIANQQWTRNYALTAYAGPEIYDLQRTKEGGAKQSGVLYGVRAGYEHIYRYKLYWGIDGLWAQGTIDGKNKDSKLKSQFTDANVEARVGYTFQCKNWRSASFTPYTGVGYFWENNFYEHPSPLHIHFKNRFAYIPLGFLSQIFITPLWSVGFNFKIRYPIDANQYVSNDPDQKNFTQNYEEKIQYRAELPITYFYCWKTASLAASLVPFYEYRPYGHRANFPFDFLETKLRLYGATLKLLYLF